MLIDSHAHLDDEKFDLDRDEVIGDLRRSGVEMYLNPGADLKSSLAAVELSKKYDFIYAAVGTHPSELDSMDESVIQTYRELCKNDKVLAIGEIGLDYYYDDCPRDLQQKWFREQIRLARELDMPYIVHDRDAHEDTLRIMKEEHYDGARGILHCYSGSPELAKEFIKLGFMISLAGPVTFKNSRVAKSVALEIPLEHLLIETDSPYMSPEPHRGKRNDPRNVRFVAETIAVIKGITYEKVEQATNDNFKRLFNLK